MCCISGFFLSLGSKILFPLWPWPARNNFLYPLYPLICPHMHLPPSSVAHWLVRRQFLGGGGSWFYFCRPQVIIEAFFFWNPQPSVSYCEPQQSHVVSASPDCGTPFNHPLWQYNHLLWLPGKLSTNKLTGQTGTKGPKTSYPCLLPPPRKLSSLENYLPLSVPSPPLVLNCHLWFFKKAFLTRFFEEKNSWV